MFELLRRKARKQVDCVAQQNAQHLVQDAAVNCIGWKELVKYHENDIPLMIAFLSDCLDDFTGILSSCEKCYRSNDLGRIDAMVQRLLGIAKCLFSSKLVDLAVECSDLVNLLLLR